MPNYLIELEDGRKFQVEADTPPTQEEFNQFLSAQQAGQTIPQQPTGETPGYLSQLGTALGLGYRQMASGVGATFNALTGDTADVAAEMVEMGKLQREQQAAQTPEDVEFMRRLEEAKKAGEEAQGPIEYIGALAQYPAAALAEPGAAFKTAVQSAPNVLISAGTQLAGRALGGLVGGAGGLELGPGAILTGIAGSIAGGALSNTLMEAGPSIYDVLNERTQGAAANMTADQIATYLKDNPDIIDEGLKTGAIRGTVIGAVESLGMKGSGKLMTMPERAAARAVQKKLVDAGVDIASKEAVDKALLDPALRTATRTAAEAAKKQFSSAGNLARLAGGSAIETGSAVGGELAAQAAAGQEIDTTEAFLEGLGEMALSVPISAANKTIEGAKYMLNPALQNPDTQLSAQAAQEEINKAKAEAARLAAEKAAEAARIAEEQRKAAEKAPTPTPISIADSPSPNLLPRATENVEPKPIRNAGESREDFITREDAWEEQYGDMRKGGRTHNDDGTPYQPTVRDEVANKAFNALKEKSFDDRIEAIGSDIGAELLTSIEQLLNDGWIWDDATNRMVDPQNRGETPLQALMRIRRVSQPVAGSATITPAPAPKQSAAEKALGLPPGTLAPSATPPSPQTGQVTAPAVGKQTLTTPTQDATSKGNIQENIREEPQDRVEGRKAEEASLGDSLLRPAEGEVKEEVITPQVKRIKIGGTSPKAQSAAQDIRSLVGEETELRGQVITAQGVKVKLLPFGESVRVSEIEVPSDLRGQGLASRVLEQITSEADRLNVSLTLSAEPFGQKGLSKEKLESWYASKGFVPSGKQGILVRKPQQLPSLTTRADPFAAAPLVDNLPALIAVRDNNATPEQVQSLVDQGLVEQVDGQNIITEAGVAAMPEDQRPKLTPAERAAEVEGMGVPVAEPSVTTPAKAATVKSTELRVGDEVSFKGNTYRVKKILSDGRVRAEFTNPEGIARIPKGSENITTLPRNVNFTRIEKPSPAPLREGAGVTGVAQPEPPRGSILEVGEVSTKTETLSTPQSLDQNKEDAKQQKKDSDENLKALNSLEAGTKTNPVFGTVTREDANEAMRLIEDGKELPNVFFTVVTTREEFLADPRNEQLYPQVWNALKTNKKIEGLFDDATNTPFVFTDGVVVYDLDRKAAQELGISPQVAAVRRVLRHENIHKGMLHLTPSEMVAMRRFLATIFSEEALDNLAKTYTKYANWRSDPRLYFQAIEEIVNQKLDQSTVLPKDGIWGQFFELLTEIWRRITGKRNQPTVKDMKDVMRLVRNGLIRSAKAQADQTKDGGNVMLSIRAYHGTRHRVGKFLLSKIGTGEGAQAYGWGLYFAEQKNVADSYRKNLTERDFINKVREVFSEFDSYDDAVTALNELDLSEGQRRLVEALRKEDWWGFDYPHQAVQAAIREPQNFDPGPEVIDALKSFGNLYTVELLADEDEFLDWDKPLSEQSEKVKNILSPIVEELIQRQIKKLEDTPSIAALYLSKKKLRSYAEDFLAPNLASGMGLYDLVRGLEGNKRGGITPDDMSRIASEYLASIGIPGIRYFDADSRRKKEGTRNYVIFDENLVKILEENGQVLTTPTDQTRDGGNVMFSYVGEKAIENLPEERRQFMRDSLDAAKAMAAAGKSSEEIRAATGWFPGKYDGKMRWEVPDEGAKMTGRLPAMNKSLPLGSVIKHDELFKAYPHFAEIPVFANALGGSEVAHWDAQGYNIALDPRSDIFMFGGGINTLLHEIQHVIQSEEGFAKGGSPDLFEVDADLKKNKAILKVAHKALLLLKLSKSRGGDIDAVVEMLKEPPYREKIARSAIELAKREKEGGILEIIQELERRIADGSTAEPSAKYLRIAGEIEARDVSARRKFTPEQRMAIAPYSSENIAPEDAIVMFRGGGKQMSMATSATDAEYLAAVEAGDMEKAQRMVDEGKIEMTRRIFDALNVRPELTQRATTIHKRLTEQGIIQSDEFENGKGLVYGDGKGVASEFLGADSYEPFPPSDFQPDYVGDRSVGNGSKISKTYETILNTFVLNVVDPQTRDFIVRDIANLLKKGGRAVIVTRGTDVLNSTPIQDFGNMSRLQKSGSGITYQKGFTQGELVEYLQKTLGEGFAVQPLKGGSAGDVRAQFVKKVDKQLPNPLAIEPRVPTINIDSVYLNYLQGDSGNDNLNQLLRDASPNERQAVVDSWVKRNPNAAARIQQVVEKVAKKAGYSNKAFHGTSGIFNAFNLAMGGKVTQAKSAKQAFFLVDDPTIAAQYARFAVEETGVGTERIISALLKGNFKTVDHGGKPYEERMFSAEIAKAKQEGFDGVRFINTNDAVFKGDIVGYEPVPEATITRFPDGKGFLLERGDIKAKATILQNGFTRIETPSGLAELVRSTDQAQVLSTFEKITDNLIQKKPIYREGNHTVFAVFNPSQIKSADPVTLDDAGNVIPPSQRFQPTSPDIRFSLPIVHSSESEASYANGQMAASMVTFTPRQMDVYSALEGAYNMSRKPGRHSVPLSELYQAALEALPDMTQQEFSEAVQTMYQNNSALLNAGESDFSVVNKDGDRVSSVVFLGKGPMASIGGFGGLLGKVLEKAKRIGEPKPFKSLRKDMEDFFEQTPKTKYTGWPFKDFESPDHVINQGKKVLEIARRFLKNMRDEGLSDMEIVALLTDPDSKFISEAINFNKNPNQMGSKVAVVEAISLMLANSMTSEQAVATDEKTKAQLKVAIDSIKNFVNGLSTASGQSLQFLQTLQGDPEISDLYNFEDLERKMRKNAQKVVDVNFGSENPAKLVDDSMNVAATQAGENVANDIEGQLEDAQDITDLELGEATLTEPMKPWYEEFKKNLETIGRITRLKASRNRASSAMESLAPEEISGLEKLSDAELDAMLEKLQSRNKELYQKMVGSESAADTNAKKDTRKKREKMINTAEKRSKQNKPIKPSKPTSPTVEQLVKMMGEARPSAEAPFKRRIQWRQLLSQPAANVAEYRERILDAIKKEIGFDGMTDEEKQNFADLFTEAWKKQYERIFSNELNRHVQALERAKKPRAAKALKESKNQLLEDIDLGVLNNDRLVEILAKRFGIKSSFTEEDKKRIYAIRDKMNKEGISSNVRNRLARELAIELARTSEMSILEVLGYIWVSSVLSGLKTMFSIGMSFLNGIYIIGVDMPIQVFSKLITGDFKGAVEQTIISLNNLARYFGKTPEALRRSWAYLVSGDTALLEAGAANPLRFMQSWSDLDRHQNVAEIISKDPNTLKRWIGLYARTVGRMLTALDGFNIIMTKGGALSMAMRQSGMDGETILKLHRQVDPKIIRQKIINEDPEFNGREPTTTQGKALLDAMVETEMYKQYNDFGANMENADFIASESAQTMNPTGVGGVFYSMVKGLDKKLKTASSSLNEKVKFAEATGQSTIEMLPIIAANYVLKFLAYNAINMIGLRFARFAGNKFNQGLSYLPLVGFMRALEAQMGNKELVGKEAAFYDMLKRNQIVGMFLGVLGIYALKAIADEPDDEERGWWINGGLENMSIDKKKQYLDQGKKPYSIGFRIGEKQYNLSYQNWPVSQIFSAIGAISDMIRFSPEKWAEKSSMDVVMAVAATGITTSLDLPALSGLRTLAGRSISSSDPSEQFWSNLGSTTANWVGGFVPKIFSDIDYLMEPNRRKYEGFWEKTAANIPVYRRYIGEDYYNIYSDKIERETMPWSRDFLMSPTEPAYRILGALNSRNIFLTPANAEYRMVGKGRNRRRLTQEEADAYSFETGKGYKAMILRYGPRALQMDPQRAKAFLHDKADQIRDRALKKVYRGYRSRTATP